MNADQKLEHESLLSDAPLRLRDGAALWFVRLRWCAVVAQAVLILSAHYLLGYNLPVVPLVVITALVSFSNFFLQTEYAVQGRLRPGLLQSTLIFDTFLLTSLLALTGGPANPFSILYLVHIILAAVVLGELWTWGMALMSICLYGFLFSFSGSMDHNHSGSYSHHLEGMWVAFAFTALLIAFFVSRILLALRERDQEAVELRLKAAKAEQFAALVNLAAGAAHELCTPLATMAIAADELRIGFSQNRNAGDQAADAELISNEIARCKKILEAMSAESGDLRGEMPTRFSLEELRKDLQAESSALGICPEALLPEKDSAEMLLPRELLSRSLLNLIRNAVDADPAGSVTIDAKVSERTIEFLVSDRGSGIAPELIHRLGEPFLTTKPPGRGMGLGVFLVRVFAERFGGRLTFQQRSPRGTIAQLSLPLVWSRT